MGSYNMGSYKNKSEWKKPGDRELRNMIAIPHAYVSRDGTGPWLVEKFREVAEGTGTLTSNDRGFAIYYLDHFLGSPIDLKFDDLGEVVEMEGPKLTLRLGSGKSGRWKRVRDEEKKT